MAKETLPLETSCICIRMRRAARQVKDFYDQILAPAGISAAQYSLLINLSRMEGCGTGELAQAVQHEKSTLVRTLQPLLDAGRIEDRSPRPSRRRQLYLTPEGKRVLHLALPLWKEAQKALRSRLGKDSEQFMATLRLFDSL